MSRIAFFPLAALLAISSPLVARVRGADGMIPVNARFSKANRFEWSFYFTSSSVISLASGLIIAILKFRI